MTRPNATVTLVQINLGRRSHTLAHTHHAAENTQARSTISLKNTPNLNQIPSPSPQRSPNSVFIFTWLACTLPLKPTLVPESVLHVCVCAVPRHKGRGFNNNSMWHLKQHASEERSVLIKHSHFALDSNKQQDLDC